MRITPFVLTSAVTVTSTPRRRFELARRPDETLSTIWTGCSQTDCRFLDCNFAISQQMIIPSWYSCFLFQKVAGFEPFNFRPLLAGFE
jgi:hypothetical protein